METGMGSSIVTFGRKHSSKKKTWELILSKGSSQHDNIDIKLFENSVLKILNQENAQMPTTVHHHDSGR